MRHRGPIAPSNTVLSPEHRAFLAGLRPRNARFAGWKWMADDDGNDDDGDSGSGDDDADKDKDKDRDKGADSGSDDLREELDRVKRRMEAADRRASEAEKKLRDQEDAKKDDLTKSQEAQQELENRVKEQDKEISGLRLQVAFLTANTQNWHDSDVALKVAQAEGYLDDIADEDGKVSKKALKKALERLSKEHPYLIASEDKQGNDGKGGPSGESAGRRSDNNKDDKARKEELRRRFPVLNR